MEYLSVKLLVNDNLTMIGYYCVTASQYNSIFTWYSELCDSIIVDDLIIDLMNFEICRIKPDKYLTMFLSEYGNPFTILESIPELEHVFTNEKILEKHDSDDIELYTETDNVSKLIHAHVTGNTKMVNELLPKVNSKDAIVSQIRNKLEYK